MTQPTQPTAVSLLTGELSEAEFERLLCASEQDPQGSLEIELVADLAAVLERRQVRASTGERSRAHAWPAHRWWAAAAALLLASWILHPGGTPTPLPMPPFLSGEVRAPAASGRVEFDQAMRPYAQGRYGAGLEALDRFLDQHPEHRPARFYRAVCLEQLGRIPQALEAYREVESTTDLLAEHATWRRAHLLLRGKEFSAARIALQQLVAQDGAYAPNAARLLEDLE